MAEFFVQTDKDIYLTGETVKKIYHMTVAIEPPTKQFQLKYG